jgi:hypothetical protein
MKKSSLVVGCVLIGLIVAWTANSSLLGQPQPGGHVAPPKVGKYQISVVSHNNSPLVFFLDTETGQLWQRHGLPGLADGGKVAANPWIDTGSPVKAPPARQAFVVPPAKEGK